MQLLASVLWGRDFDEGGERPLGLGFGGRVGYTLDNAVYLGARYEWFLGATNEEAGGTHSWRIGQLALEAGRDIGLGREFVLRPSIAAGLAYRADKCHGVYCDSGGGTKFGLTAGPRLGVAWHHGMLVVATDAGLAVFFLEPTAVPGFELGVHGGVAF
ncbi:MAG TPA: hypothetical protein VFQ35_07355 [Polyangiaceae bacterium]|nr:hypothetical protein [Polyangiaceae bacterium]